VVRLYEFHDEAYYVVRRADGDDEIGPGRKRLLGAHRNAVCFECQADTGVDQHRHAASLKMRSEPQHTFGDTQIFGVAHQRNGLK